MSISIHAFTFAIVALAAFVATAAAKDHGDCVEQQGFHCVTVTCSKWAGFTCLIEFSTLREHNPNPRGKHSAHPSYYSSVIRNDREHRGYFVKLNVGAGVNNLKVPHDFSMVVDAMGGSHRTILINKSGEIVCTGGFMTPHCDYK